MIAAVVVTRAPALVTSFFNEDEATYSALGARLAGGAIPYLGAVDHKPPGIALIYALIYRAVGDYHLFAVRVVLIAVVVATALAIGQLAVIRRGASTARIAGLVYAVVSAFGSPEDAQAANTELFAALPLVLAALAITKPRARWLIAAGVLVGIATSVRYQSALVGLAFAVVVLVEGLQSGAAARALVGRLAALALGALSVVAAFAAVMHAADALEAYWFWGWSYNFIYMATLTSHEWVINASWGILVTALWWIPLFCIMRPPRGALELAWLAAALIGLLPGGRFYLHYYLAVLPPLCLCVDAARVRPAALAASGPAVVVSLFLAFNWHSVEDRQAADDRVYRKLASAVAERTTSDQQIFVWGASPAIYHYARRTMSTRFAFCNYQTGRMWGSRYVDATATGTEAFIVPRAMHELLADLHAAPPAAIIDGGAGRLNRYDLHPLSRYRELSSWVAANYHLDTIVDGVPLYTRR